MNEGLELMIHDLASAQRKRFDKSKDQYNFFSDEAEMDIYQEIQTMKAQLEPTVVRRHRRRTYPNPYDS